MRLLRNSWLLACLLCLAISAVGQTAPAPTVVRYEPCCGLLEGDVVALRRITYSDGSQKWLTVNTSTLATAIVPVSGRMPSGRDDDLVLPDGGSNYFILMDEVARDYPRYRHGVSSYNGAGYMLTCDLCPSSKGLDRDFIEMLADKGVSPVYISVSGKWMERHAADLQWLLSLKTPRIVWVNHSLTHYYKPGALDSVNFLNRPGTDLQREILGNERLMVEKGLTPSIFFRYPGLISSPAVARAVLDCGLIPLGADAWLAKGERPDKPGSIILVHINGNEPLGLKLFREWLPTTKMTAEEFKR